MEEAERMRTWWLRLSLAVEYEKGEEKLIEKGKYVKVWRKNKWKFHSFWEVLIWEENTRFVWREIQPIIFHEGKIWIDDRIWRPSFAKSTSAGNDCDITSMKSKTVFLRDFVKPWLQNERKGRMKWTLQDKGQLWSWWEGQKMLIKSLRLNITKTNSYSQRRQ